MSDSRSIPFPFVPVSRGADARAPPHSAVIPLLWLVGAVFLFRPPAPRVELADLPVHAAMERERRLMAYAIAEEKWAKRCLWAWVAFLCVVAVAAGGVAIAIRSGA